MQSRDLQLKSYFADVSINKTGGINILVLHMAIVLF